MHPGGVKGSATGASVRLLILFFSGTGNTQFVAEYLKDHLISVCSEVRLAVTVAALEWSEPEIVTGYDVVCIGFPVHGCTAPRNVREFLARMHPVDGKGAFIYHTKGFVQGRANRIVERLARGAGFRILGSAGVRMPGSDGICMFMTNESRVFQDLLARDFGALPAADRLADLMSKAVRHLASGGDSIGLVRWRSYTLQGFLATGLLKPLYWLLGDLMSRRLHATDRCTLCGLCERICPTRNITVGTAEPAAVATGPVAADVTFGDACVLCLRCVNNCPEEAIQVGRLTEKRARWHGPKSGFRPLRYRTPRVFTENRE
jgi:ferredoxin